MIIGGLQRSSLIDYPGKISGVIFTVGCNFRCPYCHNPELVENTVDTIDEDEVLSFFNERKGKLDGVVLTGGEPTLQSDIIEFVEKIKRIGLLVKLDTNGSRPEVIEELIGRNLIDYIAMDIKAPLGKYGKVTLSTIDTRKILESINLIMSSNIGYEFRTTVVRSLLSKEDILEIGETIKSARLFVLQQFKPTKTLDPRFLSEASYTKDELEDIGVSLKRLVEKVIVR